MIDQEKESFDSDPFHRYQNDVWYFGILLVTGHTLVIECIENVYREYIKVIMHTKDVVDDLCKINGYDAESFQGAPCQGRTRAVIRKDNIVMITELANT
jgi:hypothetical protein